MTFLRKLSADNYSATIKHKNFYQRLSTVNAIYSASYTAFCIITNKFVTRLKFFVLFCKTHEQARSRYKIESNIEMNLEVNKRINEGEIS